MAEPEAKPLDYATPAAKPRRLTEHQRLARFFTVLATIFGMPFVLNGFGLLHRAMGRSNSTVRNEGLFYAAISLGIAGVCALAAFRWGSEWLRRSGK